MEGQKGLATESREPPMPVVVGVGRSGTTLLRLMLDAHPQLAIPPETGFLIEAAELAGSPAELRESLFETITARQSWSRMQLSEREFREQLETTEPFDPAEGVRAFYRLYASGFDKPRWGDKTPYYLNYIDRIEGLLPEARFVHVIRDGRDVALSMRGLWIAPGGDMGTIASHWVSEIRAGRRLGAGCRHYLEVRYEALLDDPTVELKRICAFIDLEFDQRMETYADTSRERLREMVPAGMMDKPREEIPEIIRYATTPPDRSRSQRWRSDMTRRERIAFERVAGPLLEELGYESTLPRYRRLVSRVRSGLRRRQADTGSGTEASG